MLAFYWLCKTCIDKHLNTKIQFALWEMTLRPLTRIFDPPPLSRTFLAEPLSRIG